jgi:hypothetical protein
VENGELLRAASDAQLAVFAGQSPELATRYRN